MVNKACLQDWGPLIRVFYSWFKKLTVFFE